MLLAFVITLHLSTGQVLTSTKQAHTFDQRPIKNIDVCHNYARKMQDRLNVAIQKDNYINNVTVVCNRLPRNQVITQHPPGIKVKHKKRK